MQDDLTGKRILIVEDEFYIAAELRAALQDRNAEVVGPASRVFNALALAEGPPLDAALLDINLENEASFPIARVLTDRAVPFMFVTGYDETAIPPEFHEVPRITKPFDTSKLIEGIERLVTGDRAG